MKRHSGFLFATLVTLVALSGPSIAQSSSGDALSKRVYLMVFGKRQNDLAFLSAEFCSVQNGGAIDCGSGWNNRKQMTFDYSNPLRGLSLLDLSGKQKYRYFIGSNKATGSSRFALLSAGDGRRRATPDGVTFIMTGQAGTIHVVYPSNLTAAQGISEAKRIVASHPDFGDRLSRLQFVPIKAAKMTCAKPRKNCQLGNPIDPREIVKSYRR